MKPKLLFLATEGWFVRSHFAPMVARAVADGFDTIVVARMGEARKGLEALGARLIDLPHARGDLSLLGIAQARSDVREVLAAEQPALVHAIAMKPILLAMLASGAAPNAKFVFAVTGRGHLATSKSLLAAPARFTLRTMLANRARNGAKIMVENIEDRAWIEADGALSDDAFTLLPGAGVDPALFACAAEPAGPVRIGIVTRLVRSKGVDVAIDAFAALRKTVPDAELVIAGAPDHDNPSSHQPEELDRWRATPGVRLLGFVQDVPAFWRDMHIACLPSRGGEGLPRSLIEAAASARPIVTTDVPGCRDFVADGESGYVVPVDQPIALASALARLAQDPARRQRMGEAGRARVLERYTTRHVEDLASATWARALA